MLQRNFKKKILAAILIFTLTFANFAYVTEALAVSFFDVVFGNDEGTGHENVDFDAYFLVDDEISNKIVSDVNNKDLSIKAKVSVADSGYLKDAKIELIEPDEESKLNFAVKPYDELPDELQNAEGNTFEFRHINYYDEVSEVSIPIEYKNEEYINENKLSDDFVVRFTGIYVDDDGKEFEISKDVTLTLSWEDEREVKIESSVEKYIEFKDGENKGVILQGLVKVNSEVEDENTLPVKSTEVNIQVPTIGENAPTRVEVTALSTKGTNGKFAEDVKFDSNNYVYNQEDGTLSIKVDNEKEQVVVDEYKDDFLKELEQEVVEEERYYSLSGTDEYLVTFTYQNVDIEDSVDVDLGATATVDVMSGNEEVENATRINSTESASISLTEQTGDIVSYQVETETEKVSKAYTYMNYNSDNDYEVEYKTKNIINITYKDIINNLIISDNDSEYVLADGSVIVNSDVTYKNIYLDKQNMLDILGEEGYIEVIDDLGNVLGTINNDSEVNEEGKIVASLEDGYRNLTIKTSKPISEGLLVINTTKVSKDSTLSRAEYQNAQEMRLTTNLKADYSYVDDLVQIGSGEANTNLENTITNPNIVLDRDSLSTLSRNENVEFRIELNNDKENTDPYGNSTYEIVLPENVTNVEVTNASIAYGEGLDIANVEVVNDGRFIIKVTLNGKQEKLNSGVLTNGTNIEVYANVDVDMFTPAKTDKVELRVSNEYTTEMVNDIATEVKLSAPTGVVSINTIKNYNGEGSLLTSVRQGIKSDLIDVNSEAKVATMELMVMNNNDNNVSNVRILGRVPYEGVKDILSGNDLGTTLDVRLVSGIVSENGTEFKVYYSENKEATEDLEDSSNGWVETPESLDNVKSFLIVPVDSEYEMQPAEVLKFNYQYEIPADLSHNENIYGTFITYYKNLSNEIVSDEVSAPDIVGLTTGEGPEVEIAMETDKASISEFEEVKAIVKVKNVGKDVVKDATVRIPIDESVEVKNVESSREEGSSTRDASNIIYTIPEIALDEELVITATIQVKEQVFVEGEDDSYKTFKSFVTARDLGKEIESNEVKVKIEEAEMEVRIISTNTDQIDGLVFEVGRELEVAIEPENLTDRDINNAEVTVQLPTNVSFVRAFKSTPTEIEPIEEEQYASYDEGTRTVTYRIDRIPAGVSVTLGLVFNTEDMSDGVYKTEEILVAEAKGDGTKTYRSNEMRMTVGKSSLVIHQETLTDETYVKSGSDIKYKFVIENKGAFAAKGVVLKDVLSEGLNVKSLSYKINGGDENTRKIYNNDAASISLDVPAESTAEVIVVARAKTVGSSIESTVENYGNLEEKGYVTETNKITHIVESNGSKKGITEDNKSNNPELNTNTNTNNDIVKTYKVTGTAWLDLNSNGARDNDEQKLSNINVKLVNSETGVIIKSGETDSKGQYQFMGVENGNYLVIFEFDTIRYMVTTYQKSGVEVNINSDAISTKLEYDGQQKNGAVTDVVTVKDSTVSNIDIGLVYADKFDLSLDKYISKVIIQNASGTSTKEYDNIKMAQAAIHSRQVASSTVFVEYKFIVKNDGDVAGYANKIVDYIPQGMTFVSEQNPDWYTGTDGNLYSKALEDTSIAPGEQREIKLVLSKKMTEENTGIVNNRAEIAEDYNIYGISDHNSTPGNNAQGENDLGVADLIITIRTGEVFIHVSVIITTVILGLIVIFIAYNKIVLKKKRGGV